MKGNGSEGSITVLEGKKPNVIVLLNNQPTGLLTYETEFNQARILLVCPPILDGKAYSTKKYGKVVLNILGKDWPDRFKTLLNLLENGFQYLPIKEIKQINPSEDAYICTFHNTDFTEKLGPKSNALCRTWSGETPVSNQPIVHLLYINGVELILPIRKELYFPYIHLP
ncbi:MAG: hypothetical protein CEO40_50 [Parcubacteria group bacterium LiPW_72]|nr:MAG: hypothetical protein CEO40_50 [Parcubacteria group bacterium LiPW_72]